MAWKPKSRADFGSDAAEVEAPLGAHAPLKCICSAWFLNTPFWPQPLCLPVLKNQAMMIFLYLITTYDTSRSVTVFWLFFFWLKAKFSLLLAHIENWYTGFTLHKHPLLRAIKIFKMPWTFTRERESHHSKSDILRTNYWRAFSHNGAYNTPSGESIYILFWLCNIWVFLTFLHFLIGLFLCWSYGIGKQRWLPKTSYKHGWQE